MKVAAYYNEFKGYVQYLDPEGLCDVFNRYTKSCEGFEAFCRGEDIYRSPNDDLLRFIYDPMTGEEINWNMVFSENKNLLRDD